MLAVLRHMLQVVSPQCGWRERLFQLFDTHPTVPLLAMQVPPDWRTNLFWR